VCLKVGKVIGFEDDLIENGPRRSATAHIKTNIMLVLCYGNVRNECVEIKRATNLDVRREKRTSSLLKLPRFAASLSVVCFAWSTLNILQRR